MEHHELIPTLETDQAAGVSAARSFIDALAMRDFEALERLLAPEVRFRAIVPRGVREGATDYEAVAWLRKWFGEKDSIELLDSEAASVADRAYLRYRFLAHENDLTTLIEQHAFATLVDGLIADMSLLCSGFRPVEDAAEH